MKKYLEVVKSVIALIGIILCCTKTQAATQAVTPSDYLILQSIGDYHSSGKGKCGNGAGILGAAAHFSEDHADTTCRTGYYFTAQDLAVSVQVSQHAGSDSDKWLGHELERDFRNYYGLPGDSYVMRVINGNAILAAGSGGWDYRWLSGYKVVHIGYTDLHMTKAEPIEVVQAYLVKYPSTLSSVTSADLRTAASETAWIKDEMDRRLWLCDKWFAYLQTGKTDQKTVIQNAVKSMNIFLDYRAKYFGINATDDKNLLAGYLNSNDGTSIKNKLSDYKSWWSSHKNDAISL
jgi:hypothetical protein